jgi:hypothetical protein
MGAAMEHGQQQLESAETPKVALDPEPAAVPMGPERVPDTGVLTGARGPQDASSFKSVLAVASPEQRQKFVLQLQRTAGNAAVCRWLAAVGQKYADRMAGGEPPADPDAARPR